MAEELSDFIEASGLLSYDPVAIDSIYKKNPIRLLRRLWQTLLPIGLFLLGVGWEKLIGSLDKDERKTFRAKEFTNLLVDLGPAFIKAGQALSTRPDIVPPTVLEELAQLQDQLPGFESKLAMACIEQDLDNKIENIFEEIDKEPISAASLGQVHKAKLKSGEQVAVKIQRPGLREQITLDLYIVRNIAIWFKNNIGIIRSDLVALIDELGKRIFEEMDYINEANNAEKFKELHSGNDKIAVPKIYRKATSRRVLTMEWIDGTKLTNIEAVKNLGINPNEMVEIGVSCSLQQLIEHGFFHADPHPGNILAMKDGRLCYLDFGMMSDITQQSRVGLIRAVVHLVNRRFDKLSNDFVQLGFLSEDVDLTPIAPAFESVFTTALEIGVNKMDFKAVTDDMSGIMYKFPFKLPPYYALIIRSLITLEGIALSVDPNFKILGAAYPYFARRLMEDENPELRNSLKEMLFDENTLKLERLDDLLKSATKEKQLDGEKILDQTIDFLFSKKGLVLRNELVNILASKIDSVGWKTIIRLNEKLPSKIRSKTIEKSYKINNKQLLNISSIKKIFKVSKMKSGFKRKIFFKKLPRILITKDTYRMGLGLMQKTSEKGIIRLVKVAAGVRQ
ncbi:possible protein kinase:ABC1 family [Prochlorococcus marinus str. NATL1A]|uniref:Possible protein kinase:ABC1 family n=1 Tax=Prochlorococcus marinus (strain NATL1A) TaxID=167555 RepID=A2C5J4_PROM1|nr:AarF/ABC1/UbiB kinase family protein [Prochlorococcus marinus]ABM76754.1 possible protein kinase:ABC1 family [Prochlorococcus marinus str. NATL1A]